MCYQINTIRGTPNPFKEGLFFTMARDLAPNPRTLLEYFIVPADYIARRAQLVKIFHIYQRHGDKKNINLSHWEAMAQFWKSDEDDETLDDFCIFMDESPLTVDDLESVLGELRRSRERTFRQLAQEILDKRKHTLPLEQRFIHTPTPPQPPPQPLDELEGGEEPSEAGQQLGAEPTPKLEAEVRSQQIAEVDLQGQPINPTQPTQPTLAQPQVQQPQVQIQVETAERRRVERRAWQDETPPTASYPVKCYYCKEDSTINVWEEPLDVKCPNCGGRIQGCG